MKANKLKRIVMVALALVMLEPSNSVCAMADTLQPEIATSATILCASADIPRAHTVAAEEVSEGDTSVSCTLNGRLREISEEVFGSAGKIIKNRTDAFGVLINDTSANGEKNKKAKKAVPESSDATRLRIIAVGDNLIHEVIIDDGQKSDGSYDYTPIYAKVKEYISSADVRIINQETPLVKKKEDYSGYPTFGTPYGVGEAAIDAGFNVFLLSSNHSFDKGRKGIKETLDFFDRYKGKVLTTGMYRNEDDYNGITIGEYKGIKIAFLNYTYGLNGEHPGKDGDYRVKLLQGTLISKEIAKAKKEADFVIVLPHWGTEYETTPSNEQKDFAKAMAEWGADCIIGTHPHVLQSFELIKTDDGREVPCYYSLGNFVSNMYDFVTQIEGMADIIIEKDKDGVHIEAYDLKALVNHISSDGWHHVVYPLGIYTPTLAVNRPVDSQLGPTGKQALKRIRSEFTSITGFD